MDQSQQEPFTARRRFQVAVPSAAGTAKSSRRLAIADRIASGLTGL